jgi:CHAD domain-containing protein
MTPGEAYYPLRSDAEAEQVLRRVRDRFASRLQPAKEFVDTYYDTFDWRLYKDGGTLTTTRTGRHGTLRWTGCDGRLRHRLRRTTMPPFAADFPAGPLRDDLRPVVASRRLLPIVRLTCEAVEVQILDDLDKTVATVVREGCVVARPEGDPGRPLPPALRLVPVRGYGRAAEAVRLLLEEELGLAQADSDDLARLLAAVDRTPGDYSAKLDLRLDPQMAAGDALRQIHRRLLAIQVANEAGIRADLDSEFLHDFRVACRRARSALGQITGVLPPEAADHHRKALAWLGSVTGPVRDLDVYLEKMEGYRASLPAAVRPDLAPLEGFLRARHGVEHRRLVEALASPRYRALVDGWERVLQTPPADPTPSENAARPVAALATDRTWRAYRRVLKRGRAIGPESPDAALHRLRICCKKLRYLMELFRSLYDPAAIDHLIDLLKQLQDNLGDFNDLSVQQETLRRLAHEMHETDGAPVETYLAMGRLQALLEERHAAERRRFAEVFAQFSADEERRLFRRLFKPTGEGSP